MYRLGSIAKTFGTGRCRIGTYEFGDGHAVDFAWKCISRLWGNQPNFNCRHFAMERIAGDEHVRNVLVSQILQPADRQLGHL